MDEPNQFPREPQEWLLKVVVRFGGDLKVRKILFAVKRDSACLHFALLDWTIESKSSL